MTPTLPIDLDDLDKAILRVVAEDGKISNKKLAERIGLSPSPCWQRVQRLEELGVITGYKTLFDRTLLGAPDTVFVAITLEDHAPNSPEELVQWLALLPEVLEIYLTSGTSDYLLKVAVDGTGGFEDFIRCRLYHKGGVRLSRSSFSLQCLKRIENYLPE